MPTVFPSLERRGIRPRRGQVTMIVGQPNAGKSAVAQWYAIELAKAGLDGIYFSADTDPGTISVRAASMVTGHDTRAVEQSLRDEGAQAYYADELESLSDLRWVFESSPTLDDIDLELAAFEETFGKYPDFWILDNLLNVAFDNGDEWSSIRELSKVLHHLARTTGSAIIVLHHATEADGKPEYPPARKSIQGKIAQMPELILSVARHEKEFRVACVKNRSGPADPSAKDYHSLYCDLDRMQFFDDRFAAGLAGVV